MEHPGAGAAAAAAGQGTPGTLRGSWCHPPSRHRCGILGALMACGCCCHHPWCTNTSIAARTGVHTLQAALMGTHTPCSMHTPCSTHWGVHTLQHARVQGQQRSEAPLCLPSALPRCTKAAGRQSTATRPGGAAVETHGPDRLELLESCRKRLLPHVSTRP